MEHLERPEWYDEAGAWRDAVREFDAVILSSGPIDESAPPARAKLMPVTVRNVPNDGV